jgi:hypothetical protein
MYSSVYVTLVFQPFGEFVDGGDVTPDKLRAYGMAMAARLEGVAVMVEKLTGAGWAASVDGDHVDVDPPETCTAAEVEEKLRELGIDPARLEIAEWQGDEGDEDGEAAEEPPG